MTASPLRSFEIHIQPDDDASPADDRLHFGVFVRLVETDQSARGALALPFDAAQLEQARKWVEDGLFDDDYVRKFGGQLFDALFHDKIVDLYRAVRAQTAMRLRLIVADPLAVRVPWELLYDRERESFVALDLPLVRGLPLAEGTRPLAVAQLPLRVLVVAAFPRGLPKVSADAETAGISRQLAGLVRQRAVDLHRLPNASLSQLQNSLRDAAAAGRPIHALHFIGHGRSDRRSGQAALLFETDNGEPQEVSPSTLAPILAEFDVKLAFLNACQSAQSSAVDLAEGFAPALLRAGIPCVIGMQVSVLDNVARQFADEFYAAVADNQPVDVALTHARRLALGEGRRRKADMAIPVCYLRPPSGQILELRAPETVPLTRATLAPWAAHNLRPGRLLRNVYGLIAVVATILGLILGVQAVLNEREPGKMNGVFNIAVAAFGKLDSQDRASGSQEGRDLAEDFTGSLQAAIDEIQPEFGKLLIWGPDKTGTITGDTPEQRRDAAETWAVQHGVDLLIYGNVRGNFNQTEILPEFYISDEGLGFASELAGHYPLDASIEANGEIGSLSGNHAVRIELGRQLAGWASEISRFAIGLGYFNLNQYENAQATLAESGTKDLSDQPQWSKVINLFRGSAAASRGQLADADTYYAAALAADPEYARALLGRAQIKFLRARGDCSAATQTDVEQVQEALGEFQQAGSALSDDVSEMDVKVHLFSGSAALCIASATKAPMDDALRYFTNVIDEYNDRAGNKQAQQRISYVAAEAHIRRGAAHALASDSGANSDAVAEARTDFEDGLKLASRPERQAVASWWLGKLLLWENACSAASREISRGDDAYREFTRQNPTSQIKDLNEFRCNLIAMAATLCPLKSLPASPPGVQCGERAASSTVIGP